jgi:hypothetical protein
MHFFKCQVMLTVDFALLFTYFFFVKNCQSYTIYIWNVLSLLLEPL